MRNKNISKDYFAQGCNVTLTNLKLIYLFLRRLKYFSIEFDKYIHCVFQLYISQDEFEIIIFLSNESSEFSFLALASKSKMKK